MKDRTLFSRILYLCITLILIGCPSSQASFLSTYSRIDPFPLFTSLDPHEFLLTAEKLRFMGDPFADNKHEFATLSISPYGQNADFGTNVDDQKIIGDRAVQLGDIPSRANMIALLFGELPEGRSLPPLLQEAMANLFPGVTPGSLNDGKYIDPKQLYGFFTFPTEYRKRGLRFELECNLLAGFGLQFQTGIASVRQGATAFTDLTPCAEPPCPGIPAAPLTYQNIQSYLTDRLKEITTELGYDLDDVCTTSVEEMRLCLFWRHCYELSPCAEGLRYVLFTPFLVLGGSVSPGHRADPSRYFDVGFGNNDHTSLGFAGGMDFDFSDTIELGAEIGVTHFFARDYSALRIPTSQYQTGFYPFTAPAKVQPGMNWYFGAKIATYHFLECLSFYFQFIMLEHKEDSISLCNCDPAFLPEELEAVSCFTSKFANMGFNYDVSQNIGLGFVWQAPLSQYNSYKSSTILLSFYASF